MRLFKSVENEKNKKVLASFVLLSVIVLSVVGVFIVRTMGNEEDLLANLHFNDVKVVEENGLYTYTSTLTVDEKDNVDTIKINFFKLKTSKVVDDLIMFLNSIKDNKKKIVLDYHILQIFL